MKAFFSESGKINLGCTVAELRMNLGCGGSPTVLKDVLNKKRNNPASSCFR